MKDSVIQELEADPAFARRRRMMMSTFILRMFLIGAEYSVILPSVWLYVKSMMSDSWIIKPAWVMGVIVAIYPLSAMISLPISGIIYDKTRKTREIIFVLNIFQIMGNIIYAIPSSIWNPLLGRLIAGIGEGFIASVVGEVSISYLEKHRTGMLSLMELGRVLGLILGPSLNFFIYKADYRIETSLGTWHLNNATLPGVILACGWILHSIITLLCVTNVSKSIMDKKSESTELLNKQPVDSEKKVPVDDGIIMEGVSLDTDKDGLIKEPQDVGSVTESVTSIEDKESPSFIDTCVDLFAFDFFVLFFVDIILWTAQDIFEVLLPLVTEEEFGWSQQYVGLVYVIGGIELTVIFILMYALGHKYPVQDSYLIILSLFFTLWSMALMILETYVQTLLSKQLVFAGICVLVFASIPLNLVACKALLTKIIEPERQGVVQGLFSSITRIALIIGPMLGSIAFPHRVIFAIVMAVCCVGGKVGMFLSLPSFKRRQEDMHIKRCVLDE